MNGRSNSLTATSLHRESSYSTNGLVGEQLDLARGRGPSGQG